jgi:hypothetical protein
LLAGDLGASPADLRLDVETAASAPFVDDVRVGIEHRRRLVAELLGDREPLLRDPQ